MTKFGNFKGPFIAPPDFRPGPDLYGDPPDFGNQPDLTNQADCSATPHFIQPDLGKEPDLRQAISRPDLCYHLLSSRRLHGIPTMPAPSRSHLGL